MLYLSNFFVRYTSSIVDFYRPDSSTTSLLRFLLLCPAGEILYTFTIITTDSSSALKWLHGNLFP